VLLQPIIDIAEVCAKKGLRHFIISPGSRSAHLTLALVRHPEIKTYILSDERSAAFTALGMAQHFLAESYFSKQEDLNLVGLLCTSGTAAYNYAPALAEAFFQKIPLVVFTADRPREWQNQRDGQTIFQYEIYGKHVKKSFQLPEEYENQEAIWHHSRLVNEAINLAKTPALAPVHLNLPIREPFYPKAGEKMQFNSQVKIIHQSKTEAILSKNTWQEILNTWESTEKILLVGGQHFYSPKLLKTLQNLQEDFHRPIIGDTISNLQHLPKTIRLHDIFLKKADFSLQPELLITFGKSVISKVLKIFLRENSPRWHWHIEEIETAPDTFKTLTTHFKVSPEYFFEKLFSDLDFSRLLEGEDEESDFSRKWQNLELDAKKYINKNNLWENQPFNELQAVQEVLQNLPKNSKLHLANSMSVRYANHIALEENIAIQVFANRGTSGIDGSNSTAVGDAMLEKEKIITLITGDLAFFYDNNAFWNNYDYKNLRVILLNNHAGGIFRIIQGASEQTELEEYFETSQNRIAENLAKDFNFEYQKIDTFEALQKSLQNFFHFSEKPKILEITFDSKKNAGAFKAFLKGFY